MRRLPVAWITAVVVVLTGAVIGLAAFATADEDPPPAQPRVEPVPRGDTAAEQARNLAAWLRENSR